MENRKRVRKLVAFACIILSNICRSPIAEAVLLNMVNKSSAADKWIVDSAGMDDEWLGHPPDVRARKIMKKYGLIYSNTSRPLVEKDFYEFQYILGMDENNKKFLDERKPKNSSSKCFLLGEFGLPESEKIIRDPYYDDVDDLSGFEEVYRKCIIACAAFFEAVSANRV